MEKDKAYLEIARICLEILLRTVDFEKISPLSFHGDNDYRGMRKEDFLRKARAYISCSTEDENEQIYEWLRDMLLNREDGIFEFIYEIAADFLEIDHSKIRYRKELAEEGSGFFLWRELTTKVGMEIFRAALLAKQQINQNDLAEYLCAPFPEIDYDDIKEILGKGGAEGIAENHFHLKGSFPVFLLNWSCLMNHIGDGNDFFYRFREFREREILLQKGEEKKKGLFVSCIFASCCRVHLFEIVSDMPAEQRMEFSCRRDYGEADLGMLRTYIDSYRELIQPQWNGAEKEICLDYALYDQWERCFSYDEASIAGERYFLYQCFKAVFDQRFDHEEKNLFYKYLVISLRLRSELVQTNGDRGFANFLAYQNRKEDILDYYPEYEKHIMRLTVCSLRSHQKLSSLELRISPKTEAAETLGKIRDYDRVSEAEKGSQAFGEYFYVLHFPKGREDEIVELRPRDSKLREQMDRQIEEQKILIMEQWSAYQNFGNIPRVRGYDTCSNEVGCRPEVFAQFYREIQLFTEEMGIENIRWTYHAGEDYLDLTDGLRAIDEAVNFCSLPQGSRIGHGMALGIDAEQYYQMRNGRVVLPKQDLLDNLVWTLGFCEEHGIVIGKKLKLRLEKKTQELLEEVYGNDGKPEVITLPELEMAEKEAAAAVLPVSEHSEQPDGGKTEGMEVQKAERRGISGDVEPAEAWQDYYHAWKLRGDRPQLYLDYSELLHSAVYRGALREAAAEYRKKPECRQYYAAYHFRTKVREVGKKADVFRVSADHAVLIGRMQEELREELIQRRIAVECNPSSNYQIGPFYRYEDHPMLRMYGRNLNPTPSARLNISINTDDMGIFQTYLELEYLTMYIALLKSKDRYGNARYKKEEILQWLKDVKKFGHEQAFVWKY